MSKWTDDELAEARAILSMNGVEVDSLARGIEVVQTEKLAHPLMSFTYTGGPTLRVKRLHPDARLPTYATDGAAGMDLYACESVTIPPRSIALLETGIAMEIPAGYEGQVRPRSGRLSRRGIVAVLGTIDSDFRSGIKVILENRRATQYVAHAGDRIAQLVIAPCARVAIVEADELSETVRGGGSFGSTGR